MHGGVLELESQPGVGTTVSFLLPVRQSLAGDRAGHSFAA
jgi:signal transduction histidine kinase